MLAHESSLKEATNNFHYKDASVTLRVGDKVFSVSRNLLTMRSPVFRQMLELPQQEGEPNEVILNNDPDDVAAFLVYLHSGVVDAPSFDLVSNDNLRRLLGIATIAHMYEATATAEWAIKKALAVSPLCTGPDSTSIPLLVKLISTASRWDPPRKFRQRSIDHFKATSSKFIRTVLLQSTSGLEGADEHPVAQMISMLEDIREFEPMCWVYYHVLVYFDDWQSAPWLRITDRHRLLCGYYGLSRAEISLKPPPTTVPATNDVLTLRNRVKTIELWPLFDTSRWAIPQVPHT